MSSLFNPDELGPFQPPVILCHFCFTPPSWLSHTPQGCLLYAPAWLKSANLKQGLSTTRATKTFQIILFQCLFLSDVPWFSILPALMPPTFPLTSSFNCLLSSSGVGTMFTYNFCIRHVAQYSIDHRANNH